MGCLFLIERHVAADILKTALIRLFARWRDDEGFRYSCIPIASIHDEIMLEVRVERLEYCRDILKAVMHGSGSGLAVPVSGCAPPFSLVPLTNSRPQMLVTTKSGPNWFDMTEDRE